MLTCWLAAAALGAPVELPPGEDPAVWAHPLALAGLEPGELGGASGARITATGGTWRVVVVDEHGADHVLSVTAPDDRADREALAALVSSLIHPVSLPTVGLPPVPTAPRPRPRPQPVAPAVAGAVPNPVPNPVPLPNPVPRPAVAAEGEPALRSVESVASVASIEVAAPPQVAGASTPPQVAGVEPAPEVPVDAPIRAPGGVRVPPGPLLELEDPPAPPPRLGWWAGGGPSVRVRSAVRSTVGLGAWGGVVLDRRWRLGLGVEGVAPAGVVQSGGYRLVVADVRAMGAWSPGGWELGPTIGLSWRWVDPPEWTSTSTAPTWCATGAGPSCRPGPYPVLGGLVARRVPLGPVAARLGILVEHDLYAPNLHLASGDAASVGWSAGVSASVWTR